MPRFFRRASSCGVIVAALCMGAGASPAHAGVWELCSKSERSAARLSGSMNKVVEAVEHAVKTKDDSDERKQQIGKLAGEAYPELLDAADLIEAENQKEDLGDLTPQAADLVAVIRELAGSLTGGSFGDVAPVIGEYNTTVDKFFDSCNAAVQSIPQGAAPQSIPQGGAPQSGSVPRSGDDN